MSSASSTHRGTRPYSSTFTTADLESPIESEKNKRNYYSITFRDCPECGIKVDKKQRSCHECSYNFFTRKKKKQRRTNPYSLHQTKNLKEKRAERIGGLKRKGFIYANIINYLLLFLSLWALWGNSLFQIINEPIQNEFKNIGTPTLIICILITFMCVSFKLIITSMRLRNLKSSNWQIFLLLIPFANIWLSYRLYACPPGYSDHKVLDKSGKILLVLLLVIMFPMHLIMIF